MSSDNYFIQAVLRKRVHCLPLVRFCVQASLGENKIQIDLSSLDPVSGRRVDVFNENLSKTFLMVLKLKGLSVIYKNNMKHFNPVFKRVLQRLEGVEEFWKVLTAHLGLFVCLY